MAKAKANIESIAPQEQEKPKQLLPEHQKIAELGVKIGMVSAQMEGLSQQYNILVEQKAALLKELAEESNRLKDQKAAD